jgi:hypothetical protein
MPYADPEKKRQNQRRYYHEKGAAAQMAGVKRRYRSLRAQYAEYKATKHCIKCGESDATCLEFHHVDPATKENVHPANLCRQKGWSFKRLVKYLETTCLCVCSNCHRKIHRQIREMHAAQNSRENPTV